MVSAHTQKIILKDKKNSMSSNKNGTIIERIDLRSKIRKVKFSVIGREKGKRSDDRVKGDEKNQNN